MTVIVALRNGDTVYMGGDSQGSSGSDAKMSPNGKVFRKGQYMIGVCGSYRVLQLLRYTIDLPRHQQPDDLLGFMVREFAEAVRTGMRAHGSSQIDKEVEEIAGSSSFVVSTGGRLFQVYSDFQVWESSDDFEAAGCGEAYALGALYATPKIAPMRRMRLALESAAAYSAGVSPPFTILKQTFRR